VDRAAGSHDSLAVTMVGTTNFTIMKNGVAIQQIPDD
jgi:hypothetical protein